MTGYAHKSSNGKTYYLHSRGRLFFFSSKKEGGIELPLGYKVIESERTKLPMLKKK